MTAQQPAVRRPVLLLTATITPPAGVPGLLRTDPAQRVRDYQWALGRNLRWLGTVFDRIVFVENSASDLTLLRSCCGEQHAGVEFVSFYGLDYPVSCGRGYGEFLLLDYAMSHSAVLTGLPADGVVWKLTGRYAVRNMGAMVRTAPAGYDLYCDLKDWPMPWADLRFCSFTRAGYDRWLRGSYTRFSEAENRCSPEVVFRQYVGSLRPDRRIVPRLRREPLVEGIRGLDGRSYVSASHMGKFLMRTAARVLAPWFWV